MHACFWIKWITCACVSAKLGRAVKRQKPRHSFLPTLNPLPRGTYQIPLFGAGDDPYFLLDTVLTVCYTVYMLRVGGRIFSDDVIKRLSETIQKEPVYRVVNCRVWYANGWTGGIKRARLQEMSCRKALLELDRRKEINLPKVNRHYAFQKSINLRRRLRLRNVMRARELGT